MDGLHGVGMAWGSRMMDGWMDNPNPDSIAAQAKVSEMMMGKVQTLTQCQYHTNIARIFVCRAPD